MIRRLGMVLGLISAATPVAANVPLPISAPRAVLDVTRSEDVAAVDGRWRYSDVRIVESRFLLAGADGQPSTLATTTYDIAPQAGAADFDDAPFGLPRFHDDPRRDLTFSGIYRWHEGRLTLLNADLEGPNGLASSPAEDYLYVANRDTARKVVMRYPVRADGTLGAGVVCFDMTSAPGEEALDGLKVDTAGNLYVSGPGGVWILSAQGRHLGTIRLPQLPANFAWGDEDGRTPYMTARSGLYRMRLNVAGMRP